ncbi:MAG: hypothetical protein PHQ00_00440, partial [Phycisphaerae bacterium]|nr:hypothetical protein [Phycisphaerae bacterium]
MQKTENKETANRCWPEFKRPSKELIEKLQSGPFNKALAQGEDIYNQLVDALRRDKLTKPAIFIGAGTCGLGAGASKTLEAVREYCKTKNIDADIVEVGCIGF